MDLPPVAEVCVVGSHAYVVKTNDGNPVPVMQRSFTRGLVLKVIDLRQNKVLWEHLIRPEECANPFYIEAPPP
jgi:hypothetical protein